MKKMKKLIGIMLALVMGVALCVPAMAVNGTGGTITITDARQGETYSIYKIFYLTCEEDDEGNANSYSYQVVSAWQGFLESDDYNKYFTIDSNGYLDPGSKIFEENNGLDMAEFAQAALAYAGENSISATRSQTATSETVKFSELAYGYYLINTSSGSLCMLTSTDPDANVEEKNPTPTTSKYVKDVTEKDADNDYSGSDDADVIDTLEYEIVIDNVNSLHNVSLHDDMDDELSLAEDNVFSVTLHSVNPDYDPDDPASQEYIVTTMTAGTGITTTSEYDSENNKVEVHDVINGDYYIENGTDDHSFDVYFSDEFLSTLSSTDQIYIIFQCTIDAASDSFSNDVEEYDNTAQIHYGLSSTSTKAEVQTYTYGFGVYKYTGGTTSGNSIINSTPLSDAKFVLSYTDNETEMYAIFIKLNEKYVLTGWTDNKEEATEIVTGSDGMAYIEGLEPTITYTLTETEAPDGYNKLEKPVTVKINLSSDSATNFTVTYNGTTTSTGDHVIWIVNNAGSELPGTGGMGTTIFYVIGILLVLGAAVILITRRRMSNTK